MITPLNCFRVITPTFASDIHGQHGIVDTPDREKPELSGLDETEIDELLEWPKCDSGTHSRLWFSVRI